MAVVVKLEDVLAALDLPEGWRSYLDPDTGEVVSISEDDDFLLEEEDEDREEDGFGEIPEWQRDAKAQIRRVMDSGRALSLPDSFDIHEWDLMRRFSRSVEDPDHGDELLSVIRGTGAFRLFRMTIARLGLREQWFQYRDEAVRQIARDWLDAHEIPYVEDSRGEEGRVSGDRGGPRPL